MFYSPGTVLTRSGGADVYLLTGGMIQSAILLLNGPSFTSDFKLRQLIVSLPPLAARGDTDLSPMLIALAEREAGRQRPRAACRACC